MPTFAPALLAPRSPMRCLAPAKIQGNKITVEGFPETHPRREPVGRPPLPSSPPQTSGLSEKLEDEEQEAVSPKCGLSPQGRHCPIPCRWTPNPITSSSHIRKAPRTSQNTPKEANGDTVQPPWVAGEPSPCVTAPKLGASCIPPPQPLVSPLGEGSPVCSTEAQHPRGSGTLCWP